MPKETLLAVVNREQPEHEMLALAGQVIRDGGLVAFPTETVYGLGANALDAQAVAGIFTAKERPANDPIIIHIAQVDQLGAVAVDVPDLARELAAQFWPGALTLILKRGGAVPDNITAGRDTVAVRLPAHPIAQLLIEEAGVPIGAPSANRFSRPSPTSALHVLADLQGRIDVVLDGGATDIGVESTILDLTVPEPVILRPGGITLEALRAVIPTVRYTPRYLAEGEIASAPGTLMKHYAPDASVYVFQGADTGAAVAAIREQAQQHAAAGRRVGILAADAEGQHYHDLGAEVMLLGHDEQGMASRLFNDLRALEATPVDVILVRAPKQSGLGLAVWDRLLRASEGALIQVD